MLHAGSVDDGLVDGGFELYFTAAAMRAILRDDGNCLRVVDAIDERISRESAEDDRVRSADTRARQHRDGQFRRHAHINSDAIALLDAETQKHIGELLYFGEQLRVSERAEIARLAFPQQSSLIGASALHVAVETVVGKVDLPALEPLRPGSVPFKNLVPRLEPVQLVGDVAPELFGLLDRFLIKTFVLFQALYVCLFLELRGWLELALLLQS